MYKPHLNWRRGNFHRQLLTFFSFKFIYTYIYFNLQQVVFKWMSIVCDVYCLKQNPKWLITFRKRKIQRKEEAWGQLAFCLQCHMCWYQHRWHYFPFVSGDLHPTLMASICKGKCRTHRSVVLSCRSIFWSLQGCRCEFGLWAEAHAVHNGETQLFPAPFQQMILMAPTGLWAASNMKNQENSSQEDTCLQAFLQINFPGAKLWKENGEVPFSRS